MIQKITALGQAGRGEKSQVTDSEAEQVAGKKPVIAGLILPSEGEILPMALRLPSHPCVYTPTLLLLGALWLSAYRTR